MYQGIQADIDAVMVEAVATGLFVSLCTIQQPDGIVDPAGAPSGDFVDVSGLVNIPCMNAPLDDGSIAATEAKELEEIASKGFKHILLNGYYPQATPDDQIPTNWRAIIDSVTYDILGVEHDSQHQMTRMEVELVQV